MKEKVSPRLLAGVRVQQPDRGPDCAELAQAALHAPDGRRPLPDAAVRGKGSPRHLRILQSYTEYISSVFSVFLVLGAVAVAGWFHAETVMCHRRPPDLL